MGGTISTMQRPKSEGGKKAKAESKTSKKSGWKKQEACCWGKTIGEDHKVCAADHPDDKMFHLQWPSPSQRLPQKR